MTTTHPFTQRKGERPMRFIDLYLIVVPSIIIGILIGAGAVLAGTHSTPTITHDSPVITYDRTIPAEVTP